MMAVALVAIISIGLSSCSKDDNSSDKGLLSSSLIKQQLHSYFVIAGDTVTRYLLEFKTDGTYIFDTPSLGRTEGNYRITDSIKTKYEYIDHLTFWNGVPCDTIIYYEYDATLFKIIVSESNVFDQFWVYCYLYNPIYSCAIDFEVYYNNELVKIDYPSLDQYDQLSAYIRRGKQSTEGE